MPSTSGSSQRATSSTASPSPERILTEAYARLLATKLYGTRAIDYVRSATLQDRRYLLYTPLNKMRVTMEGERIINLLAKGFERDTYFETAKRGIGGLPKLEGTVFGQGPRGGLGKIAFPDWRPIFDAFAHVPNVARFREQADGLVTLIQEAPLTPSQMQDDLDFQQCLAQIFSLVPYGRLILTGPARRHADERHKGRSRVLTSKISFGRHCRGRGSHPDR